MSPDDREYLEDMAREARTVRRFVAGFSEQDFLADQKTQYAVVRCLEIIGEAASHVSDVTRQQIAGIPWREVIAQRHVAVHHYGKLQMPRIWNTVQEHVPPLLAALDVALRDTSS